MDAGGFELRIRHARDMSSRRAEVTAELRLVSHRNVLARAVEDGSSLSLT